MRGCSRNEGFCLACGFDIHAHWRVLPCRGFVAVHAPVKGVLPRLWFWHACPNEGYCFASLSLSRPSVCFMPKINLKMLVLNWFCSTPQQSFASPSGSILLARLAWVVFIGQQALQQQFIPKSKNCKKKQLTSYSCMVKSMWKIFNVSLLYDASEVLTPVL